MSVKIRLRRMGKKKQPHYRIVVADSRSPRDGRFVENLGYYNPVSRPARLRVDLERVDYWLGEGAIASRTVGNLLTKARAGGDGTVALVGDGDGSAEAGTAETPAEADSGGDGESPEAVAADSTEAADAADSPEAADTDSPEAADTDSPTKAADTDSPEAVAEDSTEAADAESPEAAAEDSSEAAAEDSTEAADAESSEASANEDPAE